MPVAPPQPTVPPVALLPPLPGTPLDPSWPPVWGIPPEAMGASTMDRPPGPPGVPPAPPLAPPALPSLFGTLTGLALPHAQKTKATIPTTTVLALETHLLGFMTGCYTETGWARCDRRRIHWVKWQLSAPRLVPCHHPWTVEKVGAASVIEGKPAVLAVAPEPSPRVFIMKRCSDTGGHG